MEHEHEYVPVATGTPVGSEPVNTESHPPNGWVHNEDGSWSKPPSRTGTNAPGRPPISKYDSPSSAEKASAAIRDLALADGVSIKAMYADAILAAKRNMDSAEQAALRVRGTSGQSSVEMFVGISEGWSALAYACANVPGYR